MLPVGALANIQITKVIDYIKNADLSKAVLCFTGIIASTLLLGVLSVGFGVVASLQSESLNVYTYVGVILYIFALADYYVLGCILEDMQEVLDDYGKRERTVLHFVAVFIMALGFIFVMYATIAFIS